ncbi:MAG: DegT/DnrJ/EryC1/StrS family aminotransferase [Limnochordaceae bacterium]|nr:DegT/DnrJ/EryC1/StrS family aminotransferase [Limnochordaceae bacterium]
MAQLRFPATRTHVPMLDLQREYRSIQAEIDEACHGVLDSGQYVLGAEVEAFEQEAANYLHVEQAVGCASGTDALLLALLALGIGPGDEVITSPFTFFATAAAITRVGATPVFADIEPDTYGLAPQSVTELMGPRTRAVLAVHLFGQMADVSQLSRLCRQAGIWLVEDAAQAFGASWQGRPAGAWGDVAAFSFYPTKNLGAAGDGGLVTTNQPELAQRIRVLRQQGVRDSRYCHEVLGINSRLDALQAAILRVKLRHLDDWNQQRQAIAARYIESWAAFVAHGQEDIHSHTSARLADNPPEPRALLHLPQPAPQAVHIYHQFTLRTAQRTAFREHLAKDGVASEIYYPLLLPDQPVFQSGRYPWRSGPLPVAQRICREVVSVPIFPQLTVAEVEQVICSVQSFFAANVPS